MSEFKHPLRDVEISLYQLVSGNGPAFKASYGDTKKMPIFFPGDTAEAALSSAKAFAADAIEKHEASLIARKEAQAKAKAARDAKKAAE
jgi:hypothetical protein